MMLNKENIINLKEIGFNCDYFDFGEPNIVKNILFDFFEQKGVEINIHRKRLFIVNKIEKVVVYYNDLFNCDYRCLNEAVRKSIEIVKQMLK